jgi:hypothetical protein
MVHRRLLLTWLAGASLFAISTAVTASAQSSTITSGSGATCGSGATFTQCGILPVAGGTYAYPLQVSVIATTPNTITAWKVYVDGNEVQPDDNSNDINGTTGGTTGVFDTTLSAAGTGTHTIGVNTWADGGKSVLVYQVQVTIVASPLPSPAGGAYFYPNLQNAAGNNGSWQICNGTCAEGSGGPTNGSSVIELNATVNDETAPESLSGSTMMESSTGASFNTLGYRHLGCPSDDCTGLSYFLDDLWLYIPSSDNGTLRALEFDPDLFTGSTWFKMSMQCDSASGDWEFWNEATNHWIPRDAGSGDPDAPKIPCAMTGSQDQWKAGSWHHYQLYGTMDDETGGTYTYETLVLDGTTVYKNLGLVCNSLADSQGQEVNIEQQIDNESTAGTNSIYYDNYNLWVW